METIGYSLPSCHLPFSVAFIVEEMRKSTSFELSWKMTWRYSLGWMSFFIDRDCTKSLDILQRIDLVDLDALGEGHDAVAVRRGARDVAAGAARIVLAGGVLLRAVAGRAGAEVGQVDAGGHEGVQRVPRVRHGGYAERRGDAGLEERPGRGDELGRPHAAAVADGLRTGHGHALVVEAE